MRLERKLLSVGTRGGFEQRLIGYLHASDYATFANHSSSTVLRRNRMRSMRTGNPVPIHP